MKPNKPKVTQARLHELFHYDGEKLIWKVSTSNRIKVGRAAGSVNNNGYKTAQVDGQNYLAHRLIWLYCFGHLPRGQIDHINRIRDDNRIENLRDVSHTENMRNCKKQKNNKSGITGVRWHSASKKWAANIYIGNKEIHLGLFDCKWKAASKRKLAEETYGGFTKHHGT